MTVTDGSTVSYLNVFVELVPVLVATSVALADTGQVPSAGKLLFGNASVQFGAL